MENLIEQYLNEFFKELKHTPGPWSIDTFFIKDQSSDSISHILFTGKPNGQTEANSKLISQSPDMLRSICRTYLFLLVKFPFNDRQNSTVREIRISLDGTLSSLRNDISNATGLECQHIQDKFEGYAFSIDAGLTWKEHAACESRLQNHKN